MIRELTNSVTGMTGVPFTKRLKDHKRVEKLLIYSSTAFLSPLKRISLLFFPNW